MTDEPTLDTRTRILDAAERAFAEGGLAGARVAAIAAEAGVNKAMLYYYFENKQALHDAVLERVFGQLMALATAVGADATGAPAAAVMAFQEGYAQVLAEHPHIVRILLRSMLDSSGDAVAYMAPRLQQALPHVVGQVVRGQAQGTINPDLVAPLVPPSLIAPVVFFALVGPTMSSVTGIPHETLRALWLQNTREILLNGLAARPSEDA